MKKFLAVAAVLAVTSAHAEELKFGDLNYFLKQGQFNVAADVIVHNESVRSGGTNDYEIDAYLINTKYAYALTNQLNVFLGLDYTFDGKSEVASNQYDTDGLHNPQLGANFRVMNQDNAGFNLDVGAVLGLQLMDRELGGTSPKKSGNLLDPTVSNYDEPRTNLEVNARLGKKWNEANEFYTLAGFVYNMTSDIDNRSADETVELGDSLDFKLGGYYQYRPVMEFMLTLGVEATRYGEYDVEDGDQTYTDHIDYKFIFNAKYLVTESIIAKFMYTQDSRGDFDVESDAGADSEIDQRRSQQYGFGVDFLF